MKCQKGFVEQQYFSQIYTVPEGSVLRSWASISEFEDGVTKWEKVEQISFKIIIFNKWIHLELWKANWDCRTGHVRSANRLDCVCGTEPLTALGVPRAGKWRSGNTTSLLPVWKQNCCRLSATCKRGTAFYPGSLLVVRGRMRVEKAPSESGDPRWAHCGSFTFSVRRRQQWEILAEHS